MPANFTRNHKDVFTNIYTKDIWTNGSGTGSTPSYCKKYMENIQTYIKENNIENILDLGCGDWQFSQHMNWENVDYIGVDIVESVISHNIDFFTKDNIHFKCLNLSDMSKVQDFIGKEKQLILIKDVLMHWTNEEIIEWMDKLIQLLNTEHFITANNWKYYRKPEKNDQIRVLDKKYSWAPLNSQKYPLNKYDFEIIFHYRFKQVSLLKGKYKCQQTSQK
jgi:SAM-dependent methyltransferase